ncbi:MAG: SDR family NAD(P)-dependent oxidoreductase [Acetobacteraceae bacterium]|nr:SDR family NAD(P)-dependent oxidoreductase [Acetobacteraceae bacterium]
MPATLPPADRVVMVSGANRGIGLAIARHLAAAGYRLSLGARDPAMLAEATAGLPEERVLRHAFDALRPQDAEAWVAATVARFGRLDALVNNAGVLRQVTFDEGDEQMLDEMWAVNVKAPFRLVRAALPHLRRAGAGRIVTIGSTDSKRYRDGTVSVGYAMTKHAVLALSHAAKFAGWEHGVRATAILPGATRTDLLRGIPGVVPGPNRIDPETIAAAVAFVLSLPNEASVAELPINARLESTL